MDNGQWTMDRDYVPFRANPNIADPTDPTDPSEKTTAKTTNPLAISSVEAATPKKFSCLFVWFVVKKINYSNQISDFSGLRRTVSLPFESIGAGG